MLDNNFAVGITEELKINFILYTRKKNILCDGNYAPLKVIRKGVMKLVVSTLSDKSSRLPFMTRE